MKFIDFLEICYEYSLVFRTPRRQYRQCHYQADLYAPVPGEPGRLSGWRDRDAQYYL